MLVLAGLVLADRASPEPITFGSLALIIPLAAGFLLSKRLLVVVLVIGVVSRLISAGIAGVNPITAGVQTIAFLVGGALAYLAADAMRTARAQADTTERLGAIVAAATELAAVSLSPSDLVAQLLFYSVLSTGADRGDVARIEDNDLVIEAAYDSSGSPLPIGSRRKLSERPILVPLLEAKRPVRVKPVLAFPLIVEGGVHGVLTLISKKESAFTDADVAAVEQVTTIASLALRGSRLYADTQKAREEAEATSARVQRMTHERESELREHARRMEALEKLKSEFLLLASHELRGPLAVLTGYISLMQDGALGELPDRAQNAVHTMAERANAMAHLTEELLETARLEHGLQLDLKPLDLRDVAREAVQLVATDPSKEERITVNTGSDAVTVQGDRDRLVIILSSLLDMRSSTRVRMPTSLVMCQLSRIGHWLRCVMVAQASRQRTFPSCSLASAGSPTQTMRTSPARA